jgi:peptide/nickel transport system substrate-binding protein
VVGLVLLMVCSGALAAIPLRTQNGSMTPAGAPILPSPTNASACPTPLQSTNPLIVDQAEVAETADPQTAPSTPSWALVQQVYQTLVLYNGTSLTNFSGVLAQNWSTSADGFHWNFTLRSGVHFSNGDPFNAYVMWFSLYRELALYGIDQYLLSENFWFPSVNYFSNPGQVANSSANITHDLNTFDFANPNASEIAVMNATNQSFRVLSPNEIELNLGFGYLGAVPYAYLLAEIATPGAAAVDPAIIQTNGGVVEGLPNPWMQTHAVGTGPFMLTAYSAVTGYTLTPDPNYWATSLAAQEPWNNDLQPANTTFQVVYQSSASNTISDLNHGIAASAAFAYMTPSIVHQLEGNPCLVVQALPPAYGATSGSWWVFLNQSVYPFDNRSVREAIAHAINYSLIISQVFGGYAAPWVGPVPPSYPDYNPQNLTPYSHDLTLAMQEIQSSPCANNACAGTTFQYEYVNTEPAWGEVAALIAADLSQIGITVTPVGITLAQFYTERTLDPNTGQCIGSEVYEGVGPFYIGQDFYSSDYISPDDWTQEDFLSFGSANICQSGFNNYGEVNYNASLDNLVYEAAGTSNPALAAQLYANMTEIMYENYTNIWLVVPASFAIYSVDLHGVVHNPMGGAEPAVMLFNTQWASSPPKYTVTFVETGLPSGTNWSVTVNGTTQSSGVRAITFSEPNGTYPFSVGAVAGYSENRTSGEVNVSGDPVTEGIAFAPKVPDQYSVTFSESGLESGTNWSVTLNGTLHSSTTNGITFTAPNGTYPFRIAAVAGYSANLSAGSITVNGSPVQRSITFASSPGAATFLGLPTPEGYALLGGVLAAVIVGSVIAVVFRRRRKAPPGVAPAQSAPDGQNHSPPP